MYPLSSKEKKLQQSNHEKWRRELLFKYSSTPSPFIVKHDSSSFTVKYDVFSYIHKSLLEIQYKMLDKQYKNVFPHNQFIWQVNNNK